MQRSSNMTPELLRTGAKEGLGYILAIGSFALLGWVIKFILTKMVRSIENLINAGINLTASIEEYRKDQKVVNEFQRNEHKQMIESLGRINGYHKK